MKALLRALVTILLTPSPSVLAGQTGASPVVVERIWQDSGVAADLEALGQVLSDSIGARMTGSTPDLAAHEWVRSTYRRWGVPVTTSAYDSLAHGWNRGLTHVDLLSPRLRTLEANVFGYSPGTRGDVDGEVVALPDSLITPDQFRAWLPTVEGKYVLISFARPTCRERNEWMLFASARARTRLVAQWEQQFRRWRASAEQSGVPFRALPRLLERAGALGVLGDSPPMYLASSYDSTWARYIAGTMHEWTYASVTRIPMINLSCEDFALLDRLARHGRSPRIRLNSTATFGPPAPVLRTVAELRGSVNPDEYVVLGEHLDSKDAASGATDNGSGTLVAMEAMRLLKKYYPAPRRTIVAHHWSGEEEGLSWNYWFTDDTGGLARKIEVTLTQDTGTGRTVYVSLRGPLTLGAAWFRWAAELPGGVLDTVVVRPLGDARYVAAHDANSACSGIPEIWLNAYNWDPVWDYAAKAYPGERWNYRYGYHGNRDTYDLLVFDELEYNAKLMAMLAYAASEDRTLIPATAEARMAGLARCAEPGGPAMVPTRRHPGGPD